MISTILPLLLTPYTPLLVLLAFYLLPYLTRTHLRQIPSPPTASLTNLWLLAQCRLGRRSLAVHAQHVLRGPLLRIAPNHISIASPAAIPIVYGHGSGTLKSEYYDAFVSIRRGLFNTRNRAEHARKRKVVSHVFSARSVGEFEPFVRGNLEGFRAQLDSLCADAAGFAEWGEKDGETAEEETYCEIDALHWFNYLAFDIIGDLAFGEPFGMLRTGRDAAEVREEDGKIRYAPAIEVLNRRGEVSSTIGILPALKPLAPYLPDPFFRHGMRAISLLAGIASARVAARLANPSPRADLLARLMQARDESGAPLSRAELTAEALTQLIAGSDTTSNTSCAVLYHVLSASPRILSTLQTELDAALPDLEAIPTFAQVKNLPYLDAVIKETLRIHSTSSLGLPREVPPGPGLTVLDTQFPPGTVLSVPTYTLHHSIAIWGSDVEDFVPERWAPERLTEAQKSAFIPFSYGPRACVGRNVAEMEMAMIVALVFRRWEFVLRQEGWETREGFLRKPVGLRVGMRRRRG